MKKTITTMDDLAQRIKTLEMLEALQMAEVKAQVSVVIQGLKPSSLVTSAIKEITGSQTVKHTAVDTSLGMAAGWLARKFFTLNSKNKFRKMLGYGLQYITTSMVTKKMPLLRDKMMNAEN